MANNYTQSSSFITVPADKLTQAKCIAERIEEELENSEDEYAGFNWKVEDTGIWIADNGESCDPEHINMLVCALVEELQLEGVFTVSWAYICSKPRIDEFGGGAFAVTLADGKAVNFWCDAKSSVEQRAEAFLEGLETINGFE